MHPYQHVEQQPAAAAGVFLLAVLSEYCSLWTSSDATPPRTHCAGEYIICERVTAATLWSTFPTQCVGGKEEEEEPLETCWVLGPPLGT